jgi:hypothetical protein
VLAKIEARAIPFIIADDAQPPGPEEGELEAWEEAGQSPREESFFICIAANPLKSINPKK